MNYPAARRAAAGFLAAVSAMVLFACTDAVAGCRNIDRWELALPPVVASDAGFGDIAAIDERNIWTVDSHRIDGRLDFSRWDGERWRRYSTRLKEKINNVLGLDGRTRDDVWAVGVAIHDRRGETRTPLAVHWDGRLWRSVRTPRLSSAIGVFVDVVSLSRSNAWAVGWHGKDGDQDPLVEHWDGRQWEVVASPRFGGGIYDSLADVDASDPNNVWAVGTEGLRSIAIRWDGRSWNEVELPGLGPGVDVQGLVQSELRAVRVLAPDDVWLMGWELQARGTAERATQIGGQRPVFLHWNGKSWGVLRDIGMDGRAEELVSLGGSRNNVWAVGRAIGEDFSGRRPLVVHWDGKAWKEYSSPRVGGQPPGFDPPTTNQLSGLSVLPSGEAWAVGHFFNEGSARIEVLVERYCPGRS